MPESGYKSSNPRGKASKHSAAATALEISSSSLDIYLSICLSAFFDTNDHRSLASNGTHTHTHLTSPHPLPTRHALSCIINRSETEARSPNTDAARHANV